MRQLEKMGEVLVHWRDGLYYLGSITKIDQQQEICSVIFEDSSVDTVKMKDVYPYAPEDNEITCDVCGKEGSEAPNEIVLCDNCHYGYHQHCHTPPITVDALAPGVPWHCRRCIFNASVHAGGATKTGLLADMMKAVKLHLPYEIEILLWDAAHRVNEDDTYCYCGGPGEWFKRMLQCCRCLQWFHEACLQCLDNPLLYGDRCYIFVCLVCNGKEETLERLPVSREDIVHLALFNINMTDTAKNYFETSEDITDWIRSHWMQLTSSRGNPLAQRESFTENEVRAIMLEFSSRFISGTEMRKSRNVFALRVRAPPPRNTVAPSINLMQTDWNLRWPREPSPEHVIGRKRKRRSTAPPDSPPPAQSRVDESTLSTPSSLSAFRSPGRRRSASRRRAGGLRLGRLSRGGRPCSRLNGLAPSGSGSGEGVLSPTVNGSNEPLFSPPASTTLAAVRKRRGRPPGFGRGRFVVPPALSRAAVAAKAEASSHSAGAAADGEPLPADGRATASRAAASMLQQPTRQNGLAVGSSGRRLGLNKVGRGRGRGRGRWRGRAAGLQHATGGVQRQPERQSDFEAIADPDATASFDCTEEENDGVAVTEPLSADSSQKYSGYAGTRHTMLGSWEDDDLFSKAGTATVPLPSYFDGPVAAAVAAATVVSADRGRAASRGSWRPSNTRGGRARGSATASSATMTSTWIFPLMQPAAAGDGVPMRRPRGRPRRNALPGSPVTSRGHLLPCGTSAMSGSGAADVEQPARAGDPAEVSVKECDELGGKDQGEGRGKENVGNEAMETDTAADDQVKSAVEMLFGESCEDLVQGVQNALGAPQVVASGSAVFHLTARRYVNGRTSPEYLVEHESAVARHMGLPS